MISITLKKILTAKLEAVLNDYQVFRDNLSKIGQNGGNIQSFLAEEVIWEQKIKALKKLLKSSVVRPAKQSDVIEMGSRVVLLYSDGRKQAIVVDGVGMKYGKIIVVSKSSPAGKVLLGKKAGDIVELFDKKIKIESIDLPW